VENWPQDILRMEFHKGGEKIHESYSPAVPRLGDDITLGAREMPSMRYNVVSVEWFFADREDGRELKPAVILHVE
jgi:hypothetical protein